MTGRDSFQLAYDVPRGTLSLFDTYAALLVEWQGRMNLVGPSTLAEIWQRHFGDSAQLLPLGQPGSWLDMGAGAGFPGIVLALLGAPEIHLVESIAKKSAFLIAAVEALGVQSRVSVHNARIETMPAFTVANITARACAPLDTLLKWGTRFADPTTLWILPKGSTVQSEIDTAQHKFNFDLELVPSRSDDRGTVVVARHVRVQRQCG